ncbi:MAG: hypothetical protein J6Z02_09025 [Lachnospiraceae bacterium]|nr:hypothetical protein [Lachnospiraceae bacterium]
MNQKNVFRFISWILLVALLTAFMPGRVARAKKAVDMSKCTISLAKKSYTYTGKAIKPKVTVTYKGKTLKKGTDYKVTYANNVNVGKGTVKVKGLGSYTGSVNVKFKIKEKKAANDGYIHILTNKAVENLPKLTVTGDKWPCSEAELLAAWKTYYPLMEQILGPIAEDFYTQGLTWTMTDETLSHRVNEQFPATNTIEMGIGVHSTDTYQCIQGLIHETGHMWLQNNNEAISFDHGQWIWEAVTNLVGFVLTAEGVSNGQGSMLPSHADLYEYAGWDCVNGVVTDGNKAWRSVSDFTAGSMIYYLDTALSTPGTYDYWVKVNELRNKYEKADSCGFTSKELMYRILDEAADGKTMDGMAPSEWLYSRAVSNINGKDGTYLNVFGNYDDSFGHDLRFWVYGFDRKNGVETGLSGQKVTVNAYDVAGKELASGTFSISDNGTVDKRGLTAKGGGDFSANDLPANSAIRYTAKATVNGESFTDTNYNIVLGRDDKITANDDRMFFILTDAKENLVSAKEKDITVSGGTADTSGLANGLLIVHAKQGTDVKIVTKAGTYVFTKPAGARAIPIRVK